MHKISWQVGELLQEWDLLYFVEKKLQTNLLIKDYVTIKRILQMPVKVNNRLTDTAGYAHYRPVRKISLHPGLFDNEDVLRIDRVDTFLHEISHQIAHITKDEIGHKGYWAYCMVHFELKPNATYNPKIFNYRQYHERRIDRTANILAEHGFNLKGKN